MQALLLSGWYSVWVQLIPLLTASTLGKLQGPFCTATLKHKYQSRGQLCTAWKSRISMLVFFTTALHAISPGKAHTEGFLHIRNAELDTSAQNIRQVRTGAQRH